MTYILNLLFNPGYNINYIYILTVTSIIMAIYVIISKNPIVSVLFLIGLFSSISLYLIMIGLHFMGLSYLLVYVGAISILFLFILMLINVKVSELLTDNNNSLFLAVLIIFCFTYSIDTIVLDNSSMANIMNLMNIDTVNSVINNLKDIIPENLDFSKSFNDLHILNTRALDGINISVNLLYDNIQNTDISSVKSRCWDNILINLSHISIIGNILYTNQLILFILSSFILLLAMVGCIILTINKKVTSLKRYNY